MIIAIHPRHQKAVDRFVKADARYDAIVAKNHAVGKDSSLAQENAYDKAAHIFDNLPIREQQNICKTIQGY
jgi:hypothetical protein